MVWEGEVTGKGKKRHLFLFKDKLMLTEVQKPKSKGDLPTYQYKEIIDVSNSIRSIFLLQGLVVISLGACFKTCFGYFCV